jgi:putative Mn2+ efflux pump MntP
MKVCVMETYVVFLLLFTLGMLVYVIYFVKRSKEEIKEKVEEVSCKINPVIQKITGEKYECEEGEIYFKTQDKQ